MQKPLQKPRSRLGRSGVLAVVAALGPFGVAGAQSAAGAPTASPAGTNVSFYGASLARDGTLWMAGTTATVLRSVDGGASWKRQSIADAPGLDIRDIAAISRTTAYALVSSRFRGRVYKTTDGGATWVRQYNDPRKNIFFDGLAFWDEAHGVIFGDPIDGVFVVLRTEDGGTTWSSVTDSALTAETKEAAFSTGGSSLTVAAGGHAWIGTGESQQSGMARVLRTTDYGRTWQAVVTPVRTGSSSAGLFSLAFRDSLHGVAVGGDSRMPDADRSNVAVTADGGKTWQLGDTTRMTGHLFAVTYVPSAGRDVLVGVGKVGMFSSFDGGLTWQRLNAADYNTVAAGKSIVAAGKHGRVGVWPSLDAARDPATPALSRTPVKGN